MNSKTRERILSVLLAICTIICAVTAFGEDLPAPGKVISDYINATGGRDAYLAIQSSVTHGVFELQAMGLTAPITIYQALPDRNYTLIESEAFGKIESGSADGVFWEKSLMSGSRIKEGEEKVVASRDANPHKWLNWEESYPTAEAAGIQDCDSVSCYHLIMTPEIGEPENYYFGVEDKLLHQTEMIVNSEMGAIKMEGFYSDYRKTGDVLVPFTTRQILMGMQEISLTFESIEFNTDLPEGIFALPPEVSAVINKDE